MVLPVEEDLQGEVLEAWATPRLEVASPPGVVLGDLPTAAAVAAAVSCLAVHCLEAFLERLLAAPSLERSSVPELMPLAARKKVVLSAACCQVLRQATAQTHR